MSANVKALIASNLALVSLLFAFAFVAFPSSADANTRVKVIRGEIEFRSTIPCNRQGGFVRESRKQGDFVVVTNDTDPFFSASVETVTGISTTTTSIPSTIGSKTVVTSVTPRLTRLAAYDLYGCTALVVVGVK